MAQVPALRSGWKQSTNHLSAPLSFTLICQNWTCGASWSPVFARIAIVDGIDHVLKVHVWNARKPVHKSLDVRLAADLQAHGLEEAVEEGLHVGRAAQRCHSFEACRIKGSRATIDVFCWCCC